MVFLWFPHVRTGPNQQPQALVINIDISCEEVRSADPMYNVCVDINIYIIRICISSYLSIWVCVYIYIYLQYVIYV